MALFRARLAFILWAVFTAGCDFPPEEVADIRERLQAQISKGQVYVTHSDKSLSFMIKNSEFTTSSDAEKENLVGIVEKEMLALLSRYQNYQHIKIYFLGEGTTGIDQPYICQPSFNACLAAKQLEKP